MYVSMYVRTNVCMYVRMYGDTFACMYDVRARVCVYWDIILDLRSRRV